MDKATTLAVRTVLFGTVAAGAYAFVFAAGAVVVANRLGVESLIGLLAVPGWLDVAASAVAAAAIATMPSSRLRALPVWGVCSGMILLRLTALWLALDSFSFGPGADPPSVWSNIGQASLSNQGLVVFGGVFGLGLLAMVRPAPAVDP